MNANRSPCPVWDVLPVGSENAMNARDVARAVGADNRQEVSKLVQAAHRSGYPICSNVHGYFKPETPSELMQYIGSRKRRAKHTAAGTRRLEHALDEILECLKHSQTRTEAQIDAFKSRMIDYTIMGRNASTAPQKPPQRKAAKSRK